MKRTESEKLFEDLLGQKNYNFVRGDNYFKKGERCPDYYVKTPYCDIICEIKEFKKPEIDEIFKKNKIIIPAPKKVINPIKNKINDASKQLKPYEKYKKPMIVVLSNPYSYFADLSNETILSALFGELSILIPRINGKGAKWFFGRNGILINQKEYISAVCILEYVSIKQDDKINGIIKEIKGKHKDEEMDFNLATRMAIEVLRKVEAIKKKDAIKEKKELRLRVFHNFRAHIKLPVNIFNSKYDENYTYDREKNFYILQ
jgi:hypothetical protein